MGPTTVNGLPAHVLFVHFVVVLVPLAALLLILSACWPAARRRLGVLTPAVALVALVLVPLTTHAGEWLEHHTARDPLVRAHAHLGDTLLYWSAAVFVVSAVSWAVQQDRFRARLTGWARRAVTGRGVTVTVAVLAVLVAVGSVVQVYRIGDSGAKAVWHDQSTAATAPR
ncbi:hypothetical protein G4X40_04525 [Rhodococcus sp. D2-41]|uniref:DUF2231 domain-containing protein n=1 Tax=Speluncibacter jeojiensis TaxID=2710754 RepID=A0A9X4M2Q0_9ACTN|nr:DUF2231 domain-containing protein [Rhodococcus sp. D2-41]MDG3009408.1 hypothetical protein [Rhodococcus sp. D2-41]MDG3016965.1 hypothetical protein [Corynebacteriales bacterium D3-21]